LTEERDEAADELKAVLHQEIDSMVPHSKTQAAQKYWFRCLRCKYEWDTWLKPSIIFVSLSFVTDQCPNCHKKHVPAYMMECDE
jgi:hypothetical protein